MQEGMRHGKMVPQVPFDTQGMEEKLTCPFPLHVVAHPSAGPLRTKEKCGRIRTAGNPGQGVETQYNSLKQLADLVPLSILSMDLRV